jgi:hypothetical protein
MSVDRKRRARVPLFVVIGLTCFAAVVAGCPTSAIAGSPGRYFVHPYRSIRFRVHGSNGYVIGVAQGSRGHFAVTVSRGPATTVYELRHSRRWPESSLEVQGSLPGYGSFNVHFTARGKPRQLPRYSWCQGPGATIQPGIVRGSIRFSGERGYTIAFASSAKAELETLPGQRCHFGETGHSNHPPSYTATLSADHEPMSGPAAHFEALRFAPASRPPNRRVYYEASAYERLPSIWIVRRVRLATPTSTFLLPNFAVAPENAVIQPTAPFTGSATFSRTAESTFSWTGDLAVSFPGIEPVPLAGPDFRLGYCALSTCVEQESAEEKERQTY